MINSINREEFEELQDSFEELKRQVRSFTEKQNDDGYSGSQLKYPLDNFTQGLIENLIIYPVSVRLKSTDAATAANYGVFFVSERQYTVIAVAEVHGTAGSDAGAVTLQIERLQGTEAPDSGDELLSTAISLKATANTVQYGTLKTTEVVTIYRGDRLCLKDAGTLTAVANLAVTVYLQPA